MEELDKAHQAYLMWKERVLDNLKTMKSNLDADEYVPKHYVYWLEEGIKLIEEGEV